MWSGIWLTILKFKLHSGATGYMGNYGRIDSFLDYFDSTRRMIFLSRFVLFQSAINLSFNKVTLASLGWIHFSPTHRQRVGSVLDLLRPEGMVLPLLPWP